MLFNDPVSKTKQIIEAVEGLDRKQMNQMISLERNTQTIQIKYLKRNKRVKYNDEVTYKDINRTETIERVLPRQPIGTRKEAKKEVKELPSMKTSDIEKEKLEYLLDQNVLNKF